MTQKVLDLCAGIGGFTLGHMISGGFTTVAFCEINDYCQQVLNLRFPQIPIIPDIYHVTAECVYARGIREIDGIIAGLPCPPFSVAGKRQASSDERNLFTQFFQVLRSIQPRWAIVENVPGLITAEKGQFFRSVLWEFTSLGFNVEWGIMPAAEVGAVHLRERVWLIATNAKSSRGAGEQGSRGETYSESFPSAPLPLLPTPKAQDGEHPGISAHKPGQTLHLSAAVIAATSTHYHQEQKERSLNPHFVQAIMGFPQGWTDVCLPTQDLQTGSLRPQSPASIGSVVQKLQRLRTKSKQNITNSIKNTSQSEDSTSNN